ncbi:hypothetical protein CC86DRAFT_290120 [Ophiobolus disseminans]|uniref:Uncharacterized protein n=1 Tax=Ophiobolus disseminans TaxID=1469910 RepID=A0A6A7A2D2_9PLEO|nr:hypothetical protein CC86DRAFT_290120 [Ophiobolus disseminans]
MALDYVPAMVPVAGKTVNVVLQMVTFGVLCFCLIILVIYADSALFVLTTSVIVHGFGINNSREVCEGGIILCLVCYMTTKILIYYFLVERAVFPYTVFVILNFIFRITYINPNGVCIIGMQKLAMLPLIIFEIIVNIYLTLLFVLPLRALQSFKSHSNPALNRMAFRSFVGSCATLITSVTNLTILMEMKGEPGWICLMICNADILFCVIVLHWMSSREHKAEDPAWSGSGVVRPKGPAGTVGSNRDRSRRVSALVRDVVEAEKRSLHSSSGRITAPTKTLAPSGVVTECKGVAPSGFIRVLHRRGSSWDGSAGRSLRGEDEVELNNIRVQTVHTREVEIEAGAKRWASVSSGGGDRWVGSQKGVVGERIV